MPDFHDTKNIYERKVLWNSQKIWNYEVSALIGAAILQKYHELLKKDSHDAVRSSVVQTREKNERT